MPADSSSAGTAAPRQREDGETAAGFSAWWWLGLPVAILFGFGSLWHLAPAFYMAWVHGEQGVLETAQFAVMLCAFGLGLRLLTRPAVRRRPLLFGWVALATVASFYIAGEEVSWGQHLFYWSTPEYWAMVNDQQETNLHNVSSWLDQKPRALLEIGVVVGGIVLPLAALYRPQIRTGRLGIVVPPLLCLPTAVLAEATRLSERLAGWTGAGHGLLERPSEYQELYFYLFVLFYLIVLGQRLRAGPD